jgi:hypothetical protein
MLRNCRYVIVCLMILAAGSLRAGDATSSKTVYMFSSFRDNGQDGLYLAYSFDGYKWWAVHT